MPLDEVLLDAIAGTIAETEREFRGRLELLQQDIATTHSTEQQACLERIAQLGDEFDAQVAGLRREMQEQTRAEAAAIITDMAAETAKDLRERLEALRLDVQTIRLAERKACQDQIDQLGEELDAQVKGLLDLGDLLEKARTEAVAAIAGAVAATEKQIGEKLDALTESLEGTDGIEAALRIHDTQLFELRDTAADLRTDFDAGMAKMTDAVREKLREERLELAEDLLTARRRYDGISVELEERQAALKNGEPGPPGPPGPAGPPGSFGTPELWRDGIYYRGQLAFLDGSTFCARVDTAQRPPHDDWAPVALRGTDGRAGEACGLYDAKADYFKLDRVALDGSEWIARRDDPGSLPGDGWMLGARAGSKGKPGDRGPKGSDGIGIAEITARDFAIILELSDGRSTKIDLRPMFERYHQERGG